MNSRAGVLRRAGLTLVEMLVVLFIIAALLALFLPAVQHGREAAARTTCKNNLRQLALAVRGYWQVHDRLPGTAPPDAIGGWSIAILPFMEQRTLGEALAANPSLAPGTVLALAGRRPAVMTCPSASDVPSGIPGVPAAHYVLITGGRKTFRLGDAPRGFPVPWVVSPEMPPSYEKSYEGPHDGGFNIVDTEASVEWVAGSR